jgi:flagellar hook assembly protein FlgD
VHDRNRKTVVEFPERDAAPPGGEIRWNGKRADGSPVPAGTYRVTVIATDGTSVDSRTADLILGGVR